MLKLTRAALLATAFVTPLTLAQAREMTPEDVAKIESVGQVAVSPDGSRIAYTVVSLPDVTAGEKDGRSRQELMVAWEKDQAREYLPDDISPGSVTFSPDGRMIAFRWAKDGEKRAVWALPIDGGAYRKIAEVDGAHVRSFAFAPDGQSIILLANPEEDKQREAEDKKGFDAVVYEEENRLNRLFTARLGEEVDAEPREVTVPGYVSAFKVSPDGRWAAVDSAPTPQVDDSYTKKRVHILDLASGNVTRVIETQGKIDDVEIAPDGSKLSLIAGVDMNDPAPTTLYLVDPVSGAMTALNEGADEAAVDAEWLDDGRLAAVIHTGIASDLRIYSADGSVAQQIDGGDLVMTSIEAGGNRIAVRASTPTHPTELYVWKGAMFERWTDSNTWLSEINFGEQRPYRYTATDGTEIEGVLILPVGGVPNGGAPLILDVHGGPESHESNGWLTAYSGPGQVAAGQGYAVFLPNYRGSTGYGTAFSKSHQGRYTDPEFRDLVDAKRALVADGIADPDRTGITGGSYGGYATAWGTTYYSDEFAAGVMFVGISNQISKFGTTDIPYEMRNVHALAWPWEDWQKMLEVSPIYYTDRAETPLLIMHGDSDPRVSPSQSYELYRSIKVRKPETPVRLVLYPGEGHGNSRAASRYDYNLRMMRWFDTYLKTGDRDAPLPAPRPAIETETAED
ncbi:S9 family peptidase [Pseudoblastomonas halimionae]|uniref:Prolyl oligopeptidase family serine peptidase n=1 Tax=Alteriqipengyuania halimionae TaxID=1926630 RepID=A0A6I4U8M1_9SPHN|nr:S9 family peptidase [Alteriqipengyuania halimionae]MXP11193.1 prolyl oligopeptidase family serine peptidase [Alteriqipengyuania halimionae]